MPVLIKKSEVAATKANRRNAENEMLESVAHEEERIFIKTLK